MSARRIIAAILHCDARRNRAVAKSFSREFDLLTLKYRLEGPVRGGYFFEEPAPRALVRVRMAVQAFFTAAPLEL